MFKNLKWNAENVCVGDAVIKFYHSQRCPHCNYAGKGFNDLRDEGPWDFECYNCKREWSVAMDDKAKEKRTYLLNTLKKIDFLVGSAKAIRGFKKR